jgi:glycosyltransferase involved in cell wall biosynthesis
MITNHGCHAPRITVTIDTAGQNFYVNDYSKALVKQGFKVTILNRGGFQHPISKESHRGIVYYNKEWGKKLGPYCRIIYLEDKKKKFIPKEQLTEKNLEQEKDFLFELNRKLKIDFSKIYYINSHYWDAGVLGLKLNNEIQKVIGKKIPHFWTPHSLGILKKANYKNEPKYVIKTLKFPQRIAFEEIVIEQTDGVVANASVIRDTFPKYKTNARKYLWFPPGVDTETYYPRTLAQCKNAIQLLSKICKKTTPQIEALIKEKTVFFEISRAQESKRKDIILKAFCNIEKKYKEQALLIMAINKGNEVHDQLIEIYNKNKRENNIILIDEFIRRDIGAELYALADVFTTASQIESWGMTSHEGAASKCALISSKYVPSVYEVLKNEALIINKQEPKAYTKAMEKLIIDSTLLNKSAKHVHKLVFNEFSWDSLTKNFIKEIKKKHLI